MNKTLRILKRELTAGTISRRDFLKKAGELGLSVSALGFLLNNTSLAQEAVVLRWWDQFGPLEELHRQIWNNHEDANPGEVVDYTRMNPADMGQALQLAFRSEQAPDVHSLAGLGVPASQLVQEGWFTPLSNFSIDNPYLQEALYEGITVFDGNVYSFPIFSPRQHTTILWYNRDMVTAAGINPETDLITWEGVRDAANALTSGRTYGLLLPLQFTDRMQAHVTDLAEMAGAPGAIDWRSGEYAYGTQPFVDAIEFLLSFQEDGSLHPASSSLDARNGRARWAAGEAAMFFDGPWNSGAMNINFPEVIDLMDAVGIPAPTDNQTAYTYNSPTGGVFWISSQSKFPDVASAILQNFTLEEYYIGLAERMDQPPLDLSAVERANVHPTYSKVISHYIDNVRIAPDPVIRNPNVAHVQAAMRAVNPNLGEIVQGAFSGAIGNLQATLQQYADRMSAERDTAIQTVQARGLEVSIDDWIFPNWQPGVDFTADQY